MQKRCGERLLNAIRSLSDAIRSLTEEVEQISETEIRPWWNPDDDEETDLIYDELAIGGILDDE